MMTLRKAILAAGAAVGLLGAPTQAAEKITIMYTASSPFVASFLAKEQGFFAKRGLDVDFTLTQNGSLIISAIVAGQVQIGTPTWPVTMQAIDNGIDVVAVAATNQYPDPTKAGLIARAEANIKGPADLAGKKIGVPGIGGFLDVILRRWIKSSGGDARKSTFVEVPLAQTGDVLRSGAVDAVASVDPFLGRALEAKAGVFVADYTATLPAGTLAALYAASGSWVAKNPDTVKAFQEAIAEGIAFAKANESATREAVGKYTKLPPAVVATLAMPNLTARVTPQQVAFWIDIAKEQDLIKGTPDPAKIIVPWLAGN